MAKVTTAGELLISAALPPDLRQDEYDLDKKGIQQLLQRVAERHPDKYRDVADSLMRIGQMVVETTSNSLSLDSVTMPPATRAAIKKIKARVNQLSADDTLTPKQKSAEIIKFVSAQLGPLQDELYQSSLAAGNPLAIQVQSGSRGNATSFRQIVAGDGLVADHLDRIMDVPILHGYSQGLDPVEYLAASFGARKGSFDTKKAVADAGFMGKQLLQAAHRQVVTSEDCGTTNGIEVPGDDVDLVGSVLAAPVGNLKAGAILGASDVKQLRGEPAIKVRSLLTCSAPDGVCARCAGVRDRGTLPKVGDAVGIMAAQSVSEKLSQGMLSSKHGGGTVSAKGPSASGFKAINAAAQFTDSEEAAPVVPEDGIVSKVTPAPQGGFYVEVGDQRLYAPVGQNVTFKPGDKVEAGDVLTDGIPNASEVVRYRGIGDGRLYMMKHLATVLGNSGIRPHRRNLEAVVRGLVNHVRITPVDGFDGLMVDDVVPFDRVMRNWQPREGAKALGPTSARGMYLDAPALHYTVGTRITPTIAQRLSKAGVSSVTAHNDPPPFEPEPVRAMESALHDEDWMTRLSGSFLQKGFEDSVLRGRISNPRGTSYVPALAKGTDFGTTLNRTGTY